ncbi:MAG: hypothetical protein ACK504_03955 [Bacteroidota bacterium]|jgi:hypothetical protein
MEESLKEQKSKIITLLTEKSVMKQDVFKNTISTFELLKNCINEISSSMISEVKQIDKRIGIEVTEISKYSTKFKVAGDILEFFMHTNVFEFEKSHPMFKTNYIKQNKYNSYSGIINVYNFLADSLKYNRTEDLGYLVCRIFINRENHFFIESKGSIGIKYSMFSFEPINKEQLIEVINELIIFAISFDLYTPPIENIKEVSVGELQEKISSINLRTGKRLGYSSSEGDDSNLYI